MYLIVSNLFTLISYVTCKPTMVGGNIVFICMCAHATLINTYINNVYIYMCVCVRVYLH